MSRTTHSLPLSSITACLFAAFVLLMAPSTASAQNSYDMGTPASSKAGQSTASTYAMDKIETVNLANGNLSLHIPLVTIGGRGSASYSIALSYNSKLWSAQHDVEPGYTDPFGSYIQPLHHYGATFDDAIMTQPNVYALGSGWTIQAGPALKVTTVNIDPVPSINCGGNHSDDGNCGYKYLLTRLWLTLPDGSQVELRDSLTDGAPALTSLMAGGYHSWIDRDRGRVWHSTDGSAITFITDAANGVVNRQLGGWVFLSDGTRLRMEGTYSGYGTRILDRNGNFVTLDYGVANTGAMTYTDELGRQVIMSGNSTSVMITVKGYSGIADRVITIDTATIGALTSGVPTNLRADFRSLQRPFYGGDYVRTRDGDFPHADPNPHTDLFEGSENADRIDQHVTATTLHLLDGRTFRFRYNQFGELAEVVYPGGGVSQIDYVGFGSNFCEAGSAPFRDVLNRKVVQRRSLTDGINVDAVWLYSSGSGLVDGVSYPNAAVETHQGGAAGTLMSSETHYFLMLDAEYRLCLGGSTSTTLSGYEKWQNAKEFRVERQTGSGTQIEKRTWDQTPVVWGPDVGLSYNTYVGQHGQEQPQNNAHVTVEDTILENGKMKRVTYGYDNFNNVTSTSEYDFGGTDGSLGVLVRQTFRTYGVNIGSNYGIVNNSLCYSNLNPSDSNCGGELAGDLTSIIHQRRLLLNQTVKDAAGIQKAYSEFEYDNYNADANHAAAVSNSGMIQYDGTQFSLFSSSSQPRGNVTKVSHWAGGSSYIYSFTQYDNAGSVVWSEDPKGNVSTISYADNFGDGSNPDVGAVGSNGATYAMATLATNALGQQAKIQFHYTFGAPTGAKDPNGVIAKTEFDNLGRPFRATAAVGLAEQTIAETTYPTATANVATASKQLDGTRWLASKTVMDGFDRVVTGWQAEDGQHASLAAFTIRVDTVYDSIGRGKQLSNPYRPSQGESALYTTSVYDLAGRVTSITTPDNAVVTTSYSGETVTVTDQTGKQRKSVSDGLGRLIQIYEAPNDPSFNYLTSYEYDVLDDFTKVTQGTQPPRLFAYDSLKRLTSAANPESGTVNYQYDDDGNLLTKTDARNIVSTYIYDPLNRVTSRSYSDSTPAVTYTYDTLAQNGKGRLTSVSSSVSSYSYSGYDGMGRVLGGSQTIGAQIYSVGYTYDLAGHVKTMTYPSNHSVTYNYDSAGRLADKDAQNLAFTGYLGDGTLRTYASGISYSSLGGLQEEKFGTTTPIYHKQRYNSRGQLWDMRASTVSFNTDPANGDRGAIVNYYSNNFVQGGSGADNNGNLLRQENYIPGTSFFQDNFAYDALNRLTSIAEKLNGTGSDSFNQAYSYDRWGNRTISGATGTGINNLAFEVDNGGNGTNRLYAPGDLALADASRQMRYDACGNLQKDTYSASATSRTYDAENRMTKETQAGNYDAGVYSYDGDGRRVKRIVGGVETWQVYGIGGELLAEYAQNSSPSTPQREYGYRNGQLLITATVTAGSGGSAFTFTDDPLVAGTTIVKATHLTELRSAVNQARAHAGLSAATWTDDPAQATVTAIKAVHITELRARLDEARAALGLSAASYTDPTLTAGSTTAKAVHVQELRTKTNEALTAVAAGSIDLRWLVSDQLGTPRMTFDQSGSLANVSRHDYLPFGEELFANQGARAAAMGYSASDNVRQKFTQKERDIETGLDYFGARYYASTQGRFTGVDSVGPDLGNPQTLNKYQYCLNNPLAKVDRNGRYEEDVHRDLTYALALAAGFNTFSARAIANANQGVDDNPATSPMGMTPWGDDVRKRELYHFTTEYRRNEMWGTFEKSGSLQDLGTFFHAQQDRFSHEGYGPRLGHAPRFDPHWPDKTFNRPGRADVMALDTFSRMKDALSILIKNGKETIHYDAVQWKTIMPMVEDFNRARTPEEKQKIINQIVQAVQYEHYRQELERFKKKNIEADDTLQGRVRK